MSLNPPLPIIAVRKLLNSLAYPLLTIGLVTFFPPITLFVLTGSIYPTDVPPWDRNPLEMTGLFLMLSIMPAYLLVGFAVFIRINDRIYQNIAAIIEENADGLGGRYRYQGFWLAAVVVFTAIMIPANIAGDLGFHPSDVQFWVSTSIIVGSLMMWSVVGLILFFIILESLSLSRLGAIVKVDLYNLDSLNGFGRAGLHNLLMVAGALALTTLQSIDQEFRWINYRNGLLICIPAILILVPLPIWRIHRRIRMEKAKLLAEIDSHIKLASRALNEEALNKLNALMLRREQIQKLRNWPMDLSIFSRLVLYIFIPPIAWTGAALVEMIVDSFVAG